VNLELLGDSGGSSSVRITQVSKLEGDVVYCNRKGKNLFFFDLTLKLVWKGTDASGTPVSGELELLELQQDTKLEELEYSVSATDSASDATKQLVRTKGIVAVREKLREFLAALAARTSPPPPPPSSSSSPLSSPPNQASLLLAPTFACLPSACLQLTNAPHRVLGDSHRIACSCVTDRRANHRSCRRRHRRSCRCRRRCSSQELVDAFFGLGIEWRRRDPVVQERDRVRRVAE